MFVLPEDPMTSEQVAMVLQMLRATAPEMTVAEMHAGTKVRRRLG